MKIIRLIVLLPAIIIAMILANFLTQLIFNIFNTELSLFSFIWDSFLKSSIITFAAYISGIYTYPYQKKYPVLIIVSIIYLLIYLGQVFIYVYVDSSEYFKDYKFSGESIISNVANIAGSLIVLSYLWREIYIDELKP